MICPHPKSKGALRCRSCNCKAQWADPEFRARKNAISGAVLRRLKQDPEFLAKEDAGRRRSVVVMNATRRTLTAEQRAIAGRKQSARKLSWCPPALRDEYRRLVRRKRIPAAEAKRIILDQFKRQLNAA